MSALPEGYALRRAEANDFPAIKSVDRSASLLFEPLNLITGLSDFAGIPDKELEDGLADGLLNLATDPFGQVIGFTLCSTKKPDLYLDQISVHPGHGQRGIGAALMAEIIDEAKARRLKGVTLSTFRDVAWNGPFYARHGFAELPDRQKKKWMRELEAIQADTMDVSLRCFMRRPLQKSLLPGFSG